MAEPGPGGNPRGGAVHYNARQAFCGVTMARMPYFARRVDPLGQETEQLPVPSSGVPVRGARARLRARGVEGTQRPGAVAVQATLYRKLAGVDCHGSDADADADEAGIVPAPP